MSEFYPDISQYTLDDIIFLKRVKDRILDVLEYARNSEKGIFLPSHRRYFE